MTMTPTDQRCLIPGNGDSLAACLASVLDLPLDDIPDLDTGNHLEGVEGVLALKGLGFAWMAGDLEVFQVPAFCLPHVIVVGPSPRHPLMGHAVVAESSPRGLTVCFDPHPEREGVRRPWHGIIALYHLSEFRRFVSKMPE